MKSYHELVDIKIYLDKLSQGIDPITDLNFPNDTILKNKDLSIFFNKTAELINEILIETGGEIPKNIKKSKFPFYITEDEKCKIELSSTPISISKLTWSINSVINTSVMKKIRATEILTWLVRNEFLTIEVVNDNEYKVPTEKGKKLGINEICKENSYGNKYLVNLYDMEAQKFILESIDLIINDINNSF